MAAPKENQFWKLRNKHGRGKIFSSPVMLWEAACEYFQWCDDNPLKEEKVFGSGYKAKVNHKRAYTITALCFYLKINIRTWNEYKTETSYKDFFPVIEEIEQVMYSQKFEGAAVGLFNANIIARDLGLIEKKDVTTDGESLNGFQSLMGKLKNKNNGK